MRHPASDKREQCIILRQRRFAEVWRNSLEFRIGEKLADRRSAFSRNPICSAIRLDAENTVLQLESLEQWLPFRGASLRRTDEGAHSTPSFQLVAQGRLRTYMTFGEIRERNQRVQHIVQLVGVA